MRGSPSQKTDRSTVRALARPQSPGPRLVNEPSNDLVRPAPTPARYFYCKVFAFTLDGKDNLPGVDFTCLRRPDGHEIGGILGDLSARCRSGALCSSSRTRRGARAIEHGGEVVEAQDSLYGRMVTVRDPFGAEFVVGS